VTWPPAGLPAPYYADDAVVIYHGDCRELLPLLPKVDLVLTDPPYGVGLGTHADAKESRPGVGLKKQAYSAYDDTPENYRGMIVPTIRAAIGLASRAIVFSAGTMLWDLPRPDALSAIYIPSGQGSTCWGFQRTSRTSPSTATPPT
jgi:tRNA G10  N-methylase Trm11